MKSKQVLNLRRLAAVPDSEIDISDIPEWTEDDFARSVPFSSLYKPRKMQITARSIILACRSQSGSQTSVKGQESFSEETLSGSILRCFCSEGL
jgi:hypothetical protein